MPILPVSETLSPREFQQISDLAYRTCGINLKNGKQDLIQARLGKIIRQGRFGSFNKYYEHVVADQTGQELIGLLDALTTNFTSFLREPSHFEFLRQTILPELKGPIRIWSAACSTGEEPFSIAFSALEELGIQAADRIRILASDISACSLQTAGQAAYPAERFREIPPDWLPKYLLRGCGRQEGWYRVKPLVRRMIKFRRLNLMETFRPALLFHVIFCRNAMIYFDKPTQVELVSRLSACLEPGGYLLIGHSETLNGMQHPYQYVKPSVYRKPVSS